MWNSTVPDTITTWNAEAIAINQANGLGISPLTQLVVKKELFVSLELPYSIIFGEIVTVTPLVLYFGRERNALVSTIKAVMHDIVMNVCTLSTGETCANVTVLLTHGWPIMPYDWAKFHYIHV